VPHLLSPASPTGRVYGALVERPFGRTRDLALATQLDAESVHDALGQLLAAGLIHQVADAEGEDSAWEAEPPDGPASAALDAHQKELDEARVATRQLTQKFWLARRGEAHYPGLEVIRGRDQAAEHHGQLIARARREIRGFQRPPYAIRADEANAVIDGQARQLRRGITQRVVYHDSVFRGEDYIARAALASIAAGEQARVLADLPIKLVVSDDDMAMLPLDPSGVADGACLLVYPSVLLTALIDLFEVLWRIAVPIVASAPAGEGLNLSPSQLTILTLLAAGETDDTIARRLGISTRTVARQCADLFERLAVTTRFQAGVRAAHLGLLPAGHASPHTPAGRLRRS
jgi:DNA-binding CsgD family transcriptional regulator